MQIHPVVERHVIGRGRKIGEVGPLYCYRVTEKGLDALEALIEKPLCSDAVRVQVLAPLAAGRFSRNYGSERFGAGVPSWEHCGRAVSSLRQRSGAKFADLMGESLRLYRIPVFAGVNDAQLQLNTIVANAGIPTPLLESGSRVRRMLDQLMKLAAKGEDLPSAALALVQADAYLPDRIRNAEFFPSLCAELINAIWELKEEADFDRVGLSGIWSIDNWKRRIPFSVSEETARSIVTTLTDCAVEAAAEAPIAVQRVLTCTDGRWRLRARMAYPKNGHAFPSQAPRTLRLNWCVNGFPTEEACRLRRGSDSGVHELALSPSDLGERLALPLSALSLQPFLKPDQEPFELAVSGGAPLDDLAPWVFGDQGNGDLPLIGTADVRSPVASLIVAVVSGSEVEGERCTRIADPLKVCVLEDAPLHLRDLWRVEGTATVRTGATQWQIQAAACGPQHQFQFVGTPVDVRAIGCPLVFAEAPNTIQSGSLNGIIQWRPDDDREGWRTDATRALGRVRYRMKLADGSMLAERNVLVLGSNFQCRTSLNRVALRLGTGFSISGIAANSDGDWIIPFGDQRTIRLALTGPGGDAELQFNRPISTSFFRITDRTEFGETRTLPINFASVSALIARSWNHRVVFVGAGNFADRRPFLLKGGQLPLSQLRAYFQDIGFDHEVGMRPVVVEFLNGPAVSINLQRLEFSRSNRTIKVPNRQTDEGATIYELFTGGQSHSTGTQAASEQDDVWLLPELEPGHVYLVVDRSGTAKPTLWIEPGDTPATLENELAQCMSIPTAIQRRAALFDLLSGWFSNHDDTRTAGSVGSYIAWLDTFKHHLAWLDPFLVLLSNEGLALRVLGRAFADGVDGAVQGICWALAKVPFFWHRLNATSRLEAIDWVSGQSGTEVAIGFSELIRMQACMSILASDGNHGLDFFSIHYEWSADRIAQPMSPQERVFITAELNARRDRWNSEVAASFDRAMDHDQDMPHLLSIERTVQHLGDDVWASLPDPLTPNNQTRCTHPAGASMAEYVFAPFVLATLVQRNDSIDPELQDDLIYVRHFVSDSTFDDAYFYALLLLERA